MKCYHSTTKARLESIMQNGLCPNSPPEWFSSPAPYVMLYQQPLRYLNGVATVVLEIDSPEIKAEHFKDPEGLRWPNVIPPEYIIELPMKELSHAPPRIWAIKLFRRFLVGYLFAEKLFSIYDTKNQNRTLIRVRLSWKRGAR